MLRAEPSRGAVVGRGVSTSRKHTSHGPGAAHRPGIKGAKRVGRRPDAAEENPADVEATRDAEQGKLEMGRPKDTGRGGA